ncbi:MAG: hypothetical protein K0S27_1221 [Gammaproteobacteria bacterium]|jgi:hypothetical protein|nr:hypothetical protein [Gammaproteobacteria bacterium]
MSKKLIQRILLFLTSLLIASLVGAHPMPSRSVFVTVTNLCDIPIQFHVDNNWGSIYTGDHLIQAAGNVKEDQGRNTPIDVVNFIFSSNNNEEFYTVSYQGATCTIDYPIIRDYYFLDIFIAGCNRAPTCSFRPN